MSTNASIALIVLLAIIPGFLGAQIVREGKPASTKSNPTKIAAFADGKALFDKAKAKQCNTAAPKITSFKGAFDVTILDYSKPKQVSKLNGRIRQFWAKRSVPLGKKTTIQTAYRRELITDMSTEHQILSADWGAQDCYRQKVINGKEKPKVSMNRKRDEKDKANLLAEKGQISELFSLIVFNQLDVVPNSIKLEAKNQPLTIKVGRNSFPHLTSRLSLVDRNGYAFRLWIDEKTFHPVRAKVRRPGRRTWEQFDLAQHYETTLPDGKTKLVVPCNIVYYQNGKPIIEASTQDPEKAFRFNSLDKKRLEELFPEPDAFDDY